jgi:hypothetical protein
MGSLLYSLVTARRWIGLAAAAALVAGGCGGGSGPVERSPAAARDCLVRAGYAVAVRPASPALQTTAQVDVARGSLRAGVYWFDSEAAAARDAVGLGATLARTGGGMSVQRGRVVIGYARRPARADRDRLERCLVP